MNGYPLHPGAQRARDFSDSDIRDLVAALDTGLEGEVRADKASRGLYATDASIYQMEPTAVVFPAGERDVQHVLRVAVEARIPVLPRGGGTSLAGQAVNHAIVLDFTPNLGEVLEINPDESWARVQPGLVLADLNRAAGRLGLQYGIDPSTANRATIGGGIGNNSCGAHSVIYGKTIDQVLDLKTVLSDGSVANFNKLTGQELESKLDTSGLEGTLYRELRRIGLEQHDEVARRFPQIMRRVSGYNLDEFTNEHAPMDLSHIVVGSEGTLAVITEAKVRLAPMPKMKGIAAVHFRTIFEAAEATVTALEHQPSAVELIGNTIIERCRSNPGFRQLTSWVDGDPGAVLLIEFYEDSEADLLNDLNRLESDLGTRGLGYAVVQATDASLQRDMWRMREAGLGLLMSVRSDAKPVALVEDTAVAPEKLPRFIERFQEIVGRHGTESAYYGHASVGCLHIRPMVNVKSAEGLATMEAIASEIADLVLEFEGSLSGEHGDGILRGVFTERMFGPQLTNAFREIKQAFDPNRLLNPGKIIDTPGFSENLRLSPQTRNWEPVTELDFSFEGGIARAAEQCNGQGTCRKLDGGMCPSFMVTGEEEHSTRGRANLLRLTFAGALPHQDLAGERLHEALDLCVECKACKAECPSGVDLAKLKYEALAQRARTKGVPLRSRLFARIATLARLGSRLAPLANWISRQGIVRFPLHRLFGIHRQRPLPAFANRTFTSWFERRTPKSERATPRGEAVLFNDTFTNFFHPGVGQAAVRLLEALGFRVVLVERTACCGRPAISKGMLSTAREWARQNVDVLLPYAERGVPIVGVEPSCLLSFRDEYPDLLRDQASKTVAQQSFMLDELIARLASEDEDVKNIFRGDAGKQILVHAHCHQKAILGSDPTMNALRLLPGSRVELIETSCCGMAGAFGFEAEHYETSRAMGGLRLFPSIENAAPEMEIAITGVSCRQQIGHFTSRKPRHALEILADALRD